MAGWKPAAVKQGPVPTTPRRSKSIGALCLAAQGGFVDPVFESAAYVPRNALKCRFCLRPRTRLTAHCGFGHGHPRALLRAGKW